MVHLYSAVRVGSKALAEWLCIGCGCCYCCCGCESSITEQTSRHWLCSGVIRLMQLDAIFATVKRSCSQSPTVAYYLVCGSLTSLPVCTAKKTTASA